MNQLPDPLFLQGTVGRFFVLYFPASGQPKHTLLYFPPFLEEMNRCRSIVAEQARMLNSAGIAVCIMDYFGTGDSQGELEEANWDIWLKDTFITLDWLKEKNNSQITLWGARMGALLAANVANEQPDNFKNLLFWQPLTNGKQYMTQLLRLRLATIMASADKKITTNDMKKTLADGGSIEIAGQLLGGEFASQIDSQTLKTYTNLRNLNIHWMEHTSDTSRPLTPATKKAVDILSESNNVEVSSFTGAPVWQLNKRDNNPELLDKTCNLVTSWT